MVFEKVRPTHKWLPKRFIQPFVLHLSSAKSKCGFGGPVVLKEVKTSSDTPWNTS